MTTGCGDPQRQRGRRPVFDLPAGLSFSGKRLLVGNYEVDEAEEIDTG